MEIIERRQKLAVRAALQHFRNGVLAAEWLARQNPALGDDLPLFIAEESDAGLASVLELLPSAASWELP